VDIQHKRCCLNAYSSWTLRRRVQSCPAPAGPEEADQQASPTSAIANPCRPCYNRSQAAYAEEFCRNIS